MVNQVSSSVYKGILYPTASDTIQPLLNELLVLSQSKLDQSQSERDIFIEAFAQLDGVLWQNCTHSASLDPKLSSCTEQWSWNEGNDRGVIGGKQSYNLRGSKSLEKAPLNIRTIEKAATYSAHDDKHEKRERLYLRENERP